MVGHNHEHHGHDHDEPRTDQTPQSQVTVESDIAGKYLSDALRISFAILKVIMVVLILVFLASGFRTVDTDEQALVLRFGKIRGGPENRVLKPRAMPYWVFPYPVDEMVRIPVEKTIDLSVDDFWYYQTVQERLNPQKKSTRIPPSLNPSRDGYVLTGSSDIGSVAGYDSSDYNIVHTKWQLIYQLSDPEQFFQNVYVEDVKPGQVYFNVIQRSITPLIQNLLEDAVVTASVQYTIDEVLYERVAGLTEHVKRLLQAKLDAIESGIRVVQVQLTESTWPRQVDQAFQDAHTASAESERLVSEAKNKAENLLNEAGGPVAKEIVAALHDDSITEARLEQLWFQLAGSAREKIAESRAYRTDIIEAARANAEYLKELLPEYRKRPDIVVQRIYHDTIQDVLSNVDEKVIIQPGQGAEDVEVRVNVGTDPKVESELRRKRADEAQRQADATEGNY